MVSVHKLSSLSVNTAFKNCIDLKYLDLYIVWAIFVVVRMRYMKKNLNIFIYIPILNAVTATK